MIWHRSNLHLTHVGDNITVETATSQTQATRPTIDVFQAEGRPPEQGS